MLIVVPALVAGIAGAATFLLTNLLNPKKLSFKSQLAAPARVPGTAAKTSAPAPTPTQEKTREEKQNDPNDILFRERNDDGSFIVEERVDGSTIFEEQSFESRESEPFAPFQPQASARDDFSTLSPDKFGPAGEETEDDSDFLSDFNFFGSDDRGGETIHQDGETQEEPEEEGFFDSLNPFGD